MSARNPWRNGFPEMSIGELVKLGKKLRPSSKVLKRMSDDDLAKLIQTNWKKWTTGSRGCINNKISEEDLPEEFKSCKRNKIKLFRELNKKEIKNGADDSFIDGVTGGRFSVGEAGSAQGFQCMDYSLPTVNRLVNGIRFWVIIGGVEPIAKLEELIAKLNDNKKPKSGCLGGGAYLLDLPRLKKENIEYRTIIQREGDMVATLHGMYYYWVNLIDFTEVMSAYFTTDGWLEIGKKREVERCSCRKTFTLNWAKIENGGRIHPIPKAANKGQGEELEIKEDSEETTEDQGADVAQISEDLNKVTMK